MDQLVQFYSEMQIDMKRAAAGPGVTMTRDEMLATMGKPPRWQPKRTKSKLAAWSAVHRELREVVRELGW